MNEAVKGQQGGPGADRNALHVSEGQYPGGNVVLRQGILVSQDILGGRS